MPAASPETGSRGVTLREYAHTVLSLSGSERVRFAHPHREWVLVDENETVLDVFAQVDRAFAALNRLFDEEPGRVQRLRLVVVDAGVVAFTAWPRSDSPAMRAGALVAHLDDRALSDAQLLTAVRTHFLRAELGWTHIAGQQRRSAELWWFESDGEHHPVGLMVERSEEHAWQLLLDGRSRGLAATQLHSRIADVMSRLGDTRWTESHVASVRHALNLGRPATEYFGPAAVCVQAQLALADALRLTEPLGRAWP